MVALWAGVRFAATRFFHAPRGPISIDLISPRFGVYSGYDRQRAASQIHGLELLVKLLVRPDYETASVMSEIVPTSID